MQRDARLEIIIGNDSNFENQEIYDSLKNFKNFEIKVIKNSLEKGSGNNRNTAMKIAKGKFFAFLDSDDIWHPDKIRMQLAEVKKGYTFICITLLTFLISYSLFFIIFNFFKIYVRNIFSFLTSFSLFVVFRIRIFRLSLLLFLSSFVNFLTSSFPSFI